MTDDLENKLNELLGLKKQLEEITAEKQKEVTFSVLERYKKEARFNLIRFWVKIVLGLVYLTAGIIGVIFCLHATVNDIPQGTYQVLMLLIGILGFGVVIVGRLQFDTIRSKLAILQEIKQFELRITELLKK
jgi:hypothetical protein